MIMHVKLDKTDCFTPCTCMRGKSRTKQSLESGTTENFEPKIKTVPLKARQLESVCMHLQISMSIFTTRLVTSFCMLYQVLVWYEVPEK